MNAFGEACCESEEEALKKTQPAVIDVALGLAWACKDIARWLHAGVLIKRFMFAAMTKNLKPRALKDVQLRFSLTDSLERRSSKYFRRAPMTLPQRGSSNCGDSAAS